MLNDDLIAYLQPAPNRFNPCEWRDVCGVISDIRVDDHRFTIRARLPAGLYRCKLETRVGRFDMKTAMMLMVRVPDGKKLLTGPWDLDHFQNVMAMPMAKTFVNGRLKGGLWFAMPGPEQIAENRLWADFGFEAEGEETELVLEFVEHDHGRIRWRDVRYIELRRDDRLLCELRPRSHQRPRVYIGASDLKRLRKHLPSQPMFRTTIEKLTSENLPFKQQCNLDLAALVYLIIKEKSIGRKLKDSILTLCRRPTWSSRPDPLLMGGDNDRDIGSALYYTGIAREYAFDLFNQQERRIILAKADEYLRKIYDFTVLQRAYMGCPTPDAHALGTWAGVGVACMCFYDDLDSARKALPFFHGLFKDSFRLFPPGGKTNWATYYPMHLARYLAAAHTFAGKRPELSRSPFLDNLGQALLACFETPNAQEIGRGLRTHEHRYLTAFLCRFHPTRRIESIHQAFVERERKAAGDLLPTLYDLLYAPAESHPPAAFPSSPRFARDTGEIVCVSRGKKTIGCQFSAGLKAGRCVSFSLMPHNRELGMSLAQIDVSVDGSPVLINIGGYALDSSLLNTMCFEDGGARVQGQWLCGDTGPEVSAHIRRCFINDRFIYAHAVITAALHPKHGVKEADRIFLMDYRTGAIVLIDSFEGTRPLRFATHLHCSSSVSKISDTSYRLTGGQANLIAGTKGGSKGLSDDEQGEIFATVLDSSHASRVSVREPYWFPSYAYGLNFTGRENFRDAKFPRYRRWRLEMAGRVTHGRLVFALSADATGVTYREGCVTLPQSARLHLTHNQLFRWDDGECLAEAVLRDDQAGKIILLGARSISTGARKLEMTLPADVEIAPGRGAPRGVLHSPASQPVACARGWTVDAPRPNENNPHSSFVWSASFKSGP
ncbi:MAG: hypothetical protein HY360_15145 [Verrucomicrobia bacterium]|nr:hypothetical protein [Verrucomicrobiota bacterium]